MATDDSSEKQTRLFIMALVGTVFGTLVGVLATTIRLVSLLQEFGSEVFGTSLPFSKVIGGIFGNIVSTLSFYGIGTVVAVVAGILLAIVLGMYAHLYHKDSARFATGSLLGALLLSGIVVFYVSLYIVLPFAISALPPEFFW
jgi:ABC-type phosphate transport system permease subunit